MTRPSVSQITINGVDVPIQWHHTALTRPGYEPFYNLMADHNLWSSDPDSTRWNLIPLPATAEGAVLRGSSQHLGGHYLPRIVMERITEAFSEAVANQNYGGLTETAWINEYGRRFNGFIGMLQTELTLPDSPFGLVNGNTQVRAGAFGLEMNATQFWRAFDNLFDDTTLSFDPIITNSTAYQLGYQHGAQYFDFTPGTGTALDVNLNLGRDALSQQFAQDFDLQVRPQSVGLIGWMRRLGVVGSVGLTALGVSGAVQDLNAAQESQTQLLAQGDTLGAQSQNWGVVGRQLGSLTRFGAAYWASDGALQSTLQIFDAYTDDMEQAFEESYIRSVLENNYDALGRPRPEGYENWSGTASPTTGIELISLGGNGNLFEVQNVDQNVRFGVTITDVDQYTLYNGDQELTLTATDTESGGSVAIQADNADWSSKEISFEEAFGENAGITLTGEIVNYDDFTVERELTPGEDPENAASWETTFTSAPQIDERLVLLQAIQNDPSTIAGGAIGSVLGSSLGRAIGGDNVFVQVGASTVLGTLLQNVGETFGGVAAGASFEDAADAAVLDHGADFGTQLRAAGVGAVSSFLTAELADEIGLDGRPRVAQKWEPVLGSTTRANNGFGDQLFNYAAQRSSKMRYVGMTRNFGGPEEMITNLQVDALKTHVFPTEDIRTIALSKDGTKEVKVV